MALQASTGLRTKLLDTGSLKSIFNLGFIKVYAGTVPASADASIGSPTLLVTISNNNTGTGITFAASAASGSISKNGAETWSGAAVATNTAVWFRLIAAGDTGALSTTEARMQGLVNTAGAELNLVSTALINTTVYTIDAFSVGLPTL